MTREELKRHCEKQVENCEMWAKYKGEEPHGEVYEEHKLILELLEQEPCDDAISRQAVLDYIRDNYRRWFINDDAFMQCMYGIKDIISVASAEKVGHWIDDTRLGYHVSICSSCDWRGHGDVNLIYSPKYCSNCGARMQDARGGRIIREEVITELNTFKIGANTKTV